MVQAPVDGFGSPFRKRTRRATESSGRVDRRRWEDSQQPTGWAGRPLAWVMGP